MPADIQIKCRNLWKVFGSDPEGFLRRHNGAPTPDALADEGYIGAVQDVSFDVHQGEILIIMGLSGSGKSTLIRCVTRLNDPTSGTMEFEGRDLLKLSERELIDMRRHKMGMVFQNFGLLPHRDVLENVAFPLEVQGIAKDERIKRAKHMIDLVGLGGRESYFPRELSGGQQQRVGIARSLAIEPDIWFLDEPFSALDPLIRREMQDEFLRLQGLLGKTIVFITHDFDEALRLADRIAIMKDGAVEQCDTPDQIVLNPATEYVRKFTEEIDKARVVHAGVLAQANASGEGEPVDAKASVQDLARLLVHDTRAVIPVATGGRVIGGMDRAAALDILLEAS